MSELATAVHTAVARVAPITGVALADPLDRATWRVDFAPEATADERTAAAGVVTNFDLETELALVTPQVVTPFQIKEVLRATGSGTPGVSLYDDAVAWVAAQSAQVQRAWDQVVEVKRSGAVISALQARWRMTDAQVDALFRAAGAIEL